MTQELIGRFFRCPAPPIGELPFWARLAPGVKTTFVRAWEMCYASGFKDGAFAGVLGLLLAELALALLIGAIVFAIMYGLRRPALPLGFDGY